MTRGSRIIERVCLDCGKRFVLRSYDFRYFQERSLKTPVRCRACRKKWRDLRGEERKKSEAAAWQKAREASRVEFERRLVEWPLVELSQVKPDPRHTLYVIGNGFDLMHGVNSSYYGFRDSLGKNNELRKELEAFITVDDIWADFEGALGHIDAEFFGSSENLDFWLNAMDAYDVESGAAELFSAADSAVSAMYHMVDDLQKRFYKWVCGLAIGTDDRPLACLFDGAGAEGHAPCAVLDFNYTEFVEELYGVPENCVCYIHGCRRTKEKSCKRPKLVLGHAPGANEPSFYEEGRGRHKKETFRSVMISIAQDAAMSRFYEYDEGITKDCSEIIKAHEDFFSGLSEVETVITVGHSFSEVDWPYFKEIASRLGGRPLQWVFGCHGLRDLSNLEKLLNELGVDRSGVSVFRTDTIHVDKRPVAAARQGWAEPKPRERGTSEDGAWKVLTVGSDVVIVDAVSGSEVYRVEFPANVSALFFLGERLTLVSRDFPSGIYVFERKDGIWVASFELADKTERGLLTRSLNKVLLDGDRLIFVYNNRVREHSLGDGSLLNTCTRRGARNARYSGRDVTHLFLGKRR